MNWYFKIILSQTTTSGLEGYLGSIGATPDIIQYIMSQEDNSQMLTNEFRKNPQLTLQDIQQIQPAQQIDSYTDYEKKVANPYPEPMKRWIMVNLRKLRIRKDWVQESERTGVHNFYMRLVDNLPQMLDWVQRSTPSPDINSFSPEQAIEATNEWHEMISGEGEGKSYEPTNPE